MSLIAFKLEKIKSGWHVDDFRHISSRLIDKEFLSSFLILIECDGN